MIVHNLTSVPGNNNSVYHDSRSLCSVTHTRSFLLFYQIEPATCYLDESGCV